MMAGAVGSGQDRSRREFVALGLAGIGGAILSAACRGDRSFRRIESHPPVLVDALGADAGRLRATLGDYFGASNLDLVRWVGRAYEQRFSGAPEALLADLASTIALLKATGDTTARLSAAIESDFANGRSLSVFGWQLAATEAKLATVVDLTFAELAI